MSRNILRYCHFVWPTLMVIILLGLGNIPAMAADQDPTDDRTLAPYFWVNTDSPETDALPLKSSRASVEISGVIAEVTIRQVYRNEGRTNLEALYVFPMSTRAAVHALKMTIGERVIEADIMERQAARQTYETARQQGQTTSLLEQQRPNVFQMNVANILPGDEIEVQVKYTELLYPEEQIYEFVYPAVVGPRYSNTPSAEAPQSEKWIESPYLHAGQAAPYDFGIRVRLDSGIPISAVTSPSHHIETEFISPRQARIKLENESKSGDRDFILRYKLSGREIQTGLMLHQGKEDNYFLLMMEPPREIAPEKTLPREYIFILDVSGSMNGFPLNGVAKPLMNDIITRLRPEDRFNILLFAGGSALLSEGHSLAATESNKKKALSWMNVQQGGGGTEILPALKKAFALPRVEGMSRIVVTFTDGYVSVEPETFDLIRSSLGEANFFAFGIGKSVNRYLIEGMARAGFGEAFVVTTPEEAGRVAGRFLKYVQTPVLTDIRVATSGFQAYDLEPPAPPDVFIERPVILFGKFKGPASGTITVSGESTAGYFKRVIPLNQGVVPENENILPLLWARHRLMRISDMNSLVNLPEFKTEIIRLGLKYHLMTQYTSFVAVDTIKRADGPPVTVKQPLPLPAGVSDLAVGNGSMAYSARSAPAPMGAKTGGLAKPQMAQAPPAPIDKTGEEMRRKNVSLELIRIEGQRSRSEILSALKNRHSLLEECYQKSSGHRAAALSGELTIRLLIGPKGKIQKLDVVSDTLNDAPLRVCIETVLKGLALTQSSRQPCRATIKIVFRPASS